LARFGEVRFSVMRYRAVRYDLSDINMTEKQGKVDNVIPADFAQVVFLSRNQLQKTLRFALLTPVHCLN